MNDNGNDDQTPSDSLAARCSIDELRAMHDAMLEGLRAQAAQGDPMAVAQLQLGTKPFDADHMRNVVYAFEMVAKTSGIDPDLPMMR